MILRIILFLLLAVPGYGQRILVSPVLGHNLYHSDNSTALTETNNFGFFYGISTGAFSNFGTGSVLIEVSFLRSPNRAAIKEPVSDQLGNLIGYRKISMNHTVIPVEATMLFGQALSFGGGVSCAFSERELDFGIKERIQSFGAGLNALLLWQGDAGPFKYHAGLKSRYIRSLVHWGRGRDLSDFRLDFLTMQVFAGLAF